MAAPLPTSGAPPQVPDHELLQPIGGGSYGEVWLARNVLGAYRAVKVVRRASFEHDRPFEREFAGLQKFEPISRQHEGLVDLLQVGRNEAAGYFYYVMELADACASVTSESVISNQCPVNSQPVPASGEPSSRSSQKTDSLHTDLLITGYSPKTLRSEIQCRGRLPLDDCIALGLSLTRALAYLHGQGLVHRDIKPSNIIFVGDAPKLADVGLVAGVGETRSYVGTEGFIPPEGPGSPQADLYSLGILLYVMSTGKSHEDFPEPLPDLAAQPDHARWIEFNAVVHKACAANPRERYGNAEEMQADLALLQAGRSVKRKQSAQRVWARMRQVGITTMVITGFTVAGGILFRRLDENGGRSQPGAAEGLAVSSGTTNLEAWEHYTKANVCFRQFTIDGEKASRTHLTEAIRLDPNFLLAHNLLFAGYVNSMALPGHEAEAGMRAMAKKLLELYPASAEAHYANAFVDCNLEFRFAEAGRGFERAVQINPNANALSFYGWYLVFMGKQEAARAQLRRMIALDPGAPIGEQLLGSSYYAGRDYAQAFDHYQKALELAPGFLILHNQMGRAYEATGNYPSALDHFQKMELGRGRPDEELRPKYDALRQAVAESGAAGYWRTRLEQAQRRSNPDDRPYEMASILAQLGRKTEALDWLEKAYARHDGMVRLLFDHYWDGLRDEPRFQALLNTVGFAE